MRVQRGAVAGCGLIYRGVGGVRWSMSVWACGAQGEALVG
jgi:hypothetical protein